MPGQTTRIFVAEDFTVLGTQMFLPTSQGAAPPGVKQMHLESRFAQLTPPDITTLPHGVVDTGTGGAPICQAPLRIPEPGSETRYSPLASAVAVPTSRYSRLA